jgi:hypothetical protein
MTTRNATATDWKTLPLPDRHVTLPVDFSLDAAESARVRQGFIPRQMEDKWFLYCEGDTLYLHRGWTGFCIAEVRFVTHGEGLRAVGAKVNRDPEQYTSNDDQADIQLIERLARSLDAWHRYADDMDAKFRMLLSKREKQ